MNVFRIDRFKFVYWVIAIATAQHTAWGAAITMQGTQPEQAELLVGWWLQGFAFAIGVDFLMVMVATKIRNGSSAPHSFRFLWRNIAFNWYVLTFFVVAIISFYFQLLYAWEHATPLQTSGGIATDWIERLQPLIDARVIIAPSALPLIATLYTLGGLGKGGETQSKPKPPARVPTRAMGPTVGRFAALHVVRGDDAGPYPRLQEGHPAPRQSALPQAAAIRGNDGRLHGYTCPGCQKDLSIAGWSRHRKKCPDFLNLPTEEKRDVS